MKILDQVVGWALVILGATHCSFTAIVFKHFNMNAAWFLGAGLALILLGALNLLRVRYAAVAPGLRSVCIAANAVMLLFVLAVGAVFSLRQNPQAVLGVVLVAAALLLSILRPVQAALGEA